MKKTIFFAGQHIVKDKIKSFAVEVHFQLGAMAIIKFIDGSTENEYFSVDNFMNLFDDAKNKKTLHSYENNPKDFAWNFFNISSVEVEEKDSFIRKEINQIKTAYDKLEGDLMKKAEKRITEVIKEFEE